jgi:paraquat-inducible protein B
VSRHANPTVVGGFILSAVGLGIAAVAIFGGGAFLKKRLEAVAVFHGDISGLDVGAPVSMLGVRIGSVSRIWLEIDSKTLAPIVPVYFTVDPELLAFSGPEDKRGGSGERIAEAIGKGLRAQLASQSFVTGQKAIELKYLPDSPAVLAGVVASLPEIPTVASETEQLKDVLRRVPLEELAASALKALDTLDRTLSSPLIPAMMKETAATAEAANRLLQHIDEQAVPLAMSLTATSEAARETLKGADGVVADMRAAVLEAERLAADARGTVKTANEVLSANFRSTLKSAEAALRQAETALASANSLLGPATASRADIDQTLRNAAASTRSLRILMDELSRKPNAMIVGR